MVWEYLAGPLIGAAANLIGGERTNRANEEMAANRHQVEVADLLAAGLNPILSAGGSGAPMPQLHNSLGEAANAFFSAGSAMSTVDMNSATRQLTDAKRQLTEPFVNIAQVASKVTDALHQLFFGPSSDTMAGQIAEGVNTLMETYERARQIGGDALYSVVNVIGDFIDFGRDKVGSLGATAKQAWNGLLDFYKGIWDAIPSIKPSSKAGTRPRNRYKFINGQGAVSIPLGEASGVPLNVESGGGW